MQNNPDTKHINYMFPFIWSWNTAKLFMIIEIRRVATSGGRRETGTKNEITFWDDRNILYFDWSGNSILVRILQSVILKMGEFYHTWIKSIKIFKIYMMRLLWGLRQNQSHWM